MLAAHRGPSDHRRLTGPDSALDVDRGAKQRLRHVPSQDSTISTATQQALVRVLADIAKRQKAKRP